MTALVRSPSSSGMSAPEGIDVLAGDARRSDDIARALQPGAAVVRAVGTSGCDSRGQYDETGRAMVAAAETVGVRRVVAILSSGLHGSDPHPLVVPGVPRPCDAATYRDMADLEDVIAVSGSTGRSSGRVVSPTRR